MAGFLQEAQEFVFELFCEEAEWDTRLIESCGRHLNRIFANIAHQKPPPKTPRHNTRCATPAKRVNHQIPPPCHSRNYARKQRSRLLRRITRPLARHRIHHRYPPHIIRDGPLRVGHVTLAAPCDYACFCVARCGAVGNADIVGEETVTFCSRIPQDKVVFVREASSGSSAACSVPDYNIDTPPPPEHRIRNQPHPMIRIKPNMQEQTAPLIQNASCTNKMGTNEGQIPAQTRLRIK